MSPTIHIFICNSTIILLSAKEKENLIQIYMENGENWEKLGVFFMPFYENYLKRELLNLMGLEMHVMCYELGWLFFFFENRK